MRPTTYLQLKEGAAKNYFHAFHSFFGGELKQDSYYIKNAEISIRMNSYDILPEMELIVTEALYEGGLDLDRIPDDNPDYIHLALIKEGNFTQAYKSKQVNVEAGTTIGAFLYNGLFPLNAHFPAGVPVKSIGFKMTRESLNTLLPEAIPLFDRLFGSKEAIGYHSHIPGEVVNLSDDILSYRNLEFGNKSLVIARGIETLTGVFNAIRKLDGKQRLNGLHADDYQRLQQIKNKILSSLEEGIKLEDLADEFGISVSKLKRDFKTLFDSSVYQFYNHARMDEAFRRLSSGKYSVMDVGYDLGYQNLSKFSEMFKKVKGVSPKDLLP